MRGFTMIEIIVVFAILFLLIGVVILPLARNRQNQLLLESVDDVYSVLNTAQSNTLSSVNDQQYGVKIENNKVTLFTGNTYNQGVASNQVTMLQSGVEIYSGSILLNGGATSVIFDRLTGGTNQYGTIKLRLANDILKTKTITIEKTGIIKVD
jgi:type II secretory pathway pseudopilin PulG